MSRGEVEGSGGRRREGGEGRGGWERGGESRVDAEVHMNFTCSYVCYVLCNSPWFSVQ